MVCASLRNKVAVSLPSDYQFSADKISHDKINKTTLIGAYFDLKTSTDEWNYTIPV